MTSLTDSEVKMLAPKGSSSHSGLRWKTIIVVQIIAIGIGVLAALPSSPATAKVAAATAQCTRYNPPTASNVYCGQTAYHANGCFTSCNAQTTSTAVRDDDSIVLDITTTWALYYFTVGPIDYNSGISSSAIIGSSGGQYAYADCSWLDQRPGYNECTTDWH